MPLSQFDEIQWRVCPELQYESARSFQENAKVLLHGPDSISQESIAAAAAGEGGGQDAVKIQTVESLTRRLENEKELNESLMQMAVGKKDVNYGTVVQVSCHPKVNIWIEMANPSQEPSTQSINAPLA